MSFDITKIQNSSLTPGLQDLGAIPDVVLNFSGTIPINGILTATMTIPFGKSNVISLIRVNVSGGNLGQYWQPIMGSAGMYDQPGKYFMYFSVQSSALGRQINIQFVNETVGATVVLPNLAITAHAHLYNYPW